ncbi:hypothetical protein [Amycolatopsis plumensis]|uniref:TadE-like protein n=1 Tax=Amycolatopsis plumensis TaxID=236508 RepID=A0ABV5U3R1_9PSEU
MLPFLLSIIVVRTFGADAQAAAEAELNRQGLSAPLLAEHGSASARTPPKHRYRPRPAVPVSLQIEVGAESAPGVVVSRTCAAA